ncbi:MAG: hypothetical protein EBU46_19830, partial [Nitrosomonadaceae bacterium]|nr:hypothetical protein [Nitrosomonadaceae bacterium]
MPVSKNDVASPLTDCRGELQSLSLSLGLDRDVAQRAVGGGRGGHEGRALGAAGGDRDPGALRLQRLQVRAERGVPGPRELHADGAV